MNKLWNIRPANLELASSIAKEFSLSLPIAQLLAQRGLVETGAIRDFLNPRLGGLQDPFLLPDMDKAVRRVLQAVRDKEKIIVYGDYDADGMTSMALLLEVLGKMGAHCGYFLPSRFIDGYGLKMEPIRRCIAEGARLILSVDCGTNSAPEIRYAKSCGVDIVVLDHHEHDGTPFEAVAVVNPKRRDSACREELASVGIAFKLAHALLKSLRSNLDGIDKVAASIDLKEVLDYVAIGTIADMVPLVGENRILAKAGLDRFDQTTHPGLRILRDLAGIHASPSAVDIAFRIAPRLNANGRLSDAQDALALLRSSSETQAMVLAQRLHQENARRQHIEQKATEEAIAMVWARHELQKDAVLVLYQPHWHVGVVGIVANKLQKEFGKPAVVIGSENGLGKGSARSIEGFHMAQALSHAASTLVSCGGHAGAAGITIELDRVETFRKAINHYARQVLLEKDLVQRLDVDMELAKDRLDTELIDQLNCLEPYGSGNPRPIFATAKIGLEGPPQVVGKKHLKFQTRIKDTLFDVMGFRMAERLGTVAGRKLDIAYHPCVNVFNGQRRFQLNLEDFRFSS